MCLAEKCQIVTAFDSEQSVLCSPVCLGLTAKYGHYLRILVESRLVSLQSRVNGGASGIQTFGTV